MARLPHLVTELSILTSPGRAGRIEIIPDQLEITRLGCRARRSEKEAQRELARRTKNPFSQWKLDSTKKAKKYF